MSLSNLFKRHAINFLLALVLTSGAAATGLQAGGGLPAPIVVSGPDTEALSLKDRIEVFQDVWETVNEKYYDPFFNGVDWQAVRDRYRRLIEQSDSDEEFYRLLKRMVGELHDAHTRFHTPEERRERERLQAVSAGVSIFEVEGKPVVVGVEHDSDAARAGVEEGMIVLAIDGMPVADRLAEAKERVDGSSTDRAVRLRIYRTIIDGESGTALRMRLARGDGSSLDVVLTRRIVPDVAVVTSRRLPSGFGYIRLTLWRSPIRKRFKSALEEFKNAPGVVIDIRGNPGGEAEEVVKIASYFFNSRVPFGRFSARSGKTVYLRTDDDDQIYGGRVAILVNEGSGSGSELFAGVMQESGRAVVVGRQTCGCVLGISKFRKKGNGELAISEYGYRSPQGKTFEGTGVIPEKAVALTIADLQHHRDAALEEAERLIRTKTETKVGTQSSDY